MVSRATSVTPRYRIHSAINAPCHYPHEAIVGLLTIFFSPSKPTFKVGRVETAVALLHHFERLAIPHMPRDTTTDVDRSMRQAVRDGEQIQKHLLQARRLAMMTPKQDKQLPTVLSTDQQQCRTTLAVKIQDDEHLDLAKQTSMCSPGKFHGNQEPVGIPSPVAPFCVETSTQTFLSFLELIKGVRKRKRPVPSLPARTPAVAEKADSSTSPNGKRTREQEVVTVSIGPESCGDTTKSDAKVKPFNSQTSKQQRADPPAFVKGFAVASRPVILEVLRGTLKLLKINLFHLVRVATIRRSCRGHGVNPPSPQIGGNPVSIEARAESEGHQGSGLKQRRVVDKHGPTEKMVSNPDRVQFLGSRPSNDVANVGRENKSTSPVFQGSTVDGMGQNGYQGGSMSADDVHLVIGEIYDELKTLLEEDIAKEDPETTDAALSVQVSSVSR